MNSFPRVDFTLCVMPSVEPQVDGDIRVSVIRFPDLVLKGIGLDPRDIRQHGQLMLLVELVRPDKPEQCARFQRAVQGMPRDTDVKCQLFGSPQHDFETPSLYVYGDLRRALAPVVEAGILSREQARPLLDSFERERTRAGQQDVLSRLRGKGPGKPMMH